MIRSYLGKSPKIADNAFIDDTAIIIGDVEIGSLSSIWFYSIVRGDVNYIRIGERTNVQDGCILHVTLNKFPLIIGNNVTIGHGAILHGCVVRDYCLIGMGAKILDGATIEPYSLVGAGSLVKEGFTVPEGHLVAGVPARVIRPLSDEEKRKIEQSAQNYINYFRNYLKED